MADLATDVANRSKLVAGASLVTPDMVSRLDDLLAHYEGRFSMPKEFVVPGASLVGAHLDVARTVVRRAERVAVALAPESTAALAYLNRLSDLLWALARWQDGTSQTARPT
jgi:cob(I)alamin adenosyltransferase